MKTSLNFSPLLLFIVALLVAIPALFINLGELPVIDDEAIRALVAFEMLEKGDFITPSIAGELYLKKPPLYNWLIISSYQLLGRYDELAVRLPMVLSLLAFTFLIFYFYKREMNTRLAVMVSLAFLTSGRVLIYESLYGLIDLTYSLVIFTFFMHIYRCFMRGNLLSLFLSGYFLIAIGFLLKGLPSIVFLGITLLVLFISNKKFKLLFHWGHYLGVLLFLAIVGGYYFIYFSRNDISPMEMIDVVLGESTRRTAVRFGFWNTVLHLLSYPFEVLFHFMPWGLMVLLLIKKGSFRLIRKHPFIRYTALVFLANIIIYWTSPEVFPRYILMLIPLLFGIFMFIYLEQQKERTIYLRVFEYLMGGLIGMTVLVGLVPFVVDLPINGSSLIAITTIMSVILLALSYSYWKNKSNRILWVVLVLLICRIGFDLIIIPTRLSDSEEIAGKELAKEIVDMTGEGDLQFWWNPEIGPSDYYAYRVTTYRFNYYLCLYKDKVVPLSQNSDANIYYVSKLGFLKDKDPEILKVFRPAGQPSDLVLFQFEK